MAVIGRKTQYDILADIPKCGPCGEVGNECKDASGYCVDCPDYLCDDCFQSHGRSRASRHHKLLTNDELSTEDVTKLQSSSNSTETCSKHKSEIIKYFCTEHNVLGCSDCIILDHKLCHLDYIPQVSEGFADTKEFSDTTLDLEKELKSIGDVLQKVNVAGSLHREISAQCLKDIDKFQSEMIEQIRSLGEKLKVQVKARLKKSQVDIEQTKLNGHQMASELERVMSQVQKSKADASQLFINTKKAQDVLKTQKARVKELCLTSDELLFHFVPDNTLSNTLANTKTLGTLVSPEQIDCLEPVSHSAVLLGVPPESNYDDVKVSLEGIDNKNSVRKIDLLSDNGIAIIRLKDPDAVTQVCTGKRHTFSGQNVKIMPLVEFINRPASESLIKVDQDIRFYKITKLASDIENELSVCHAVISWSSEPVSVTCTDKKYQRNLIRSWTTDVNDVLQVFAEKLMVKKYHLPQRTLKRQKKNWNI